MKMVLIDETDFEAKVVDLKPSTCEEELMKLMPEMRMCGFITRNVGGVECTIMHDDEFLAHGRNFTGIMLDGEEILMGSLLVCGIQEDPTDDIESMGLRDLTDDECKAIIDAWCPVSPELAERYARRVHPSLMFMMGSNALQYKYE